MYFDHKPCEVCGGEVRLKSREELTPTEPDGTVDERVCTNKDCATHHDDSLAP